MLFSSLRSLYFSCKIIHPFPKPSVQLLKPEVWLAHCKRHNGFEVQVKIPVKHPRLEPCKVTRESLRKTCTHKSKPISVTNTAWTHSPRWLPCYMSGRNKNRDIWNIAAAKHPRNVPLNPFNPLKEWNREAGGGGEVMFSKGNKRCVRLKLSPQTELYMFKF